MNDRKKKEVFLYVAVGVIILAAIIFLLVLIMTKSGAGDGRGGQGNRDGQPTRPTGDGAPTVPPIPTATPAGGDDDDGSGNHPSGGNRRPSGGDDDGNGKPSGWNGTPTPGGGDDDGNGKPSGWNGTPTPGGGDGGGNGKPSGWNGSPTPGGGDGGGNGKPSGWNGSPTPSGGNDGGNEKPSGWNGSPTPSGGNDDGNEKPSGWNGSPTPSGGGDNENGRPSGGRITPTPTGGNGNPSPSGGRTTPTPTGGNGNPSPSGGRTTPTPTGGNGNPSPSGGRTTPTPTGGNGNPNPSGGRTSPTPTGGNGNPSPSGGRITPTPTGGNGNPNPTGGRGTPTPTPRIGGPTPTPKNGGTTPGSGGSDGSNRPTPTVYDPFHWDSDLNAFKIEEQWDGGFNGRVNLGDDRWENYLSDLFTRVSPDYSVDALNVLDMEGQELFMRMSGMYDSRDSEGKVVYNTTVTRQSLARANQEKWDQIAEEIHGARCRWQLEEIMIKYLVQKADYKQTYLASYEQVASGVYATDEEHKRALQKSDCYRIIADLQNVMGKRGLGYSWNEALGTVLRNSGDPMAEVVTALDNVELFMKMGNFFNGNDFDTLSYEKKQLWWQIENDITDATSTDRLEELIAKYTLTTEQARKNFETELNQYNTATARRNAFLTSDYYKYVQSCQQSYKKIEGYETWDQALAAVLKGRVSQSGNVSAGGSVETPQTLNATPTPTPRMGK